MLHSLIEIARLAVSPGSVDYVGGTCTAADAHDLSSRLRAGESVGDGPHIAEFESALSSYYDGMHAITFGAANMALFALLGAMGCREGDEVIVPGYTCVVIPNAIRWAGLTPVYVDVSRQDFNLMPELVERAVTSRTRAILAQGTFGIPCDMEALGDVSRRTGVPILEDGAHAIGARWDGRLMGHFGLAAFFSTQATKMITTERGGFIVTGDASLADRLREIQADTPFTREHIGRAEVHRWCYRARRLGSPLMRPRALALEGLARGLRLRRRLAILDYDADEYRSALAGEPFSPYPVRLGNLMAHGGLLQLRRLDADLAHRRRLAELLERELPAFGARVAEFDHRRAEPSWVRFPFVVEDRSRWQASMKRVGLPPGVWLDDPIHPRGSDSQRAQYRRGQCPNGEYLANHILNVPTHGRVSERRIRRWLRDLSFMS